jgi:ribosomal protein L9
MLTLRSIKELEFDRAMGKVSVEDFDDMAGRLRARAIGLMKQLDREGSAYESIIERDVAARAAKSARRAENDSVELPPARHVCTCGVQNDVDARFCKSCGSRLEAA